MGRCSARSEESLADVVVIGEESLWTTSVNVSPPSSNWPRTAIRLRMADSWNRRDPGDSPRTSGSSQICSKKLGSSRLHRLDRTAEDDQVVGSTRWGSPRRARQRRKVA